MDAELSIRRYRPADRERVEAVMESALRETGAFFENAPDDTDDTLVNEFLESGGEFLVGEVDDRIVATGAFRPVGGLVAEYLDTIPDGAVEIKRMHVAPEHQRKGYGQRLFDELQHRARDRGYAELLLNTSDLQTAALNFYESNGFEEVERESIDAFGRSFDLIIYRKSLADSASDSGMD